MNYDTETEALAATTGTQIVVDNGPHVSPRFSVIEPPKVGDKVSYGFNGDYYPDGEIVKISGKNLRIVTTSTGSKFWRRGNSGRWVMNGTWSLVPGHRSERNPSF